MLFVTIHQREDKHPPHQFQFSQDEIVIGRLQTNDIVLAKGNISKNHAKILKKQNQFIVTDLNSTNRTFVNGQAVKPASPTLFKVNDKINIGDFVLQLSSTPQLSLPIKDGNQSKPVQPPKPITPQRVAARQNQVNPTNQVPPAPQKPAPPPIPQRQSHPPIIPPNPPLSKELGHPKTQSNTWQQIAMIHGPHYSYTAIPQGWLLLSPSGNFTFIADTRHQTPPSPIQATQN